MLLASRSFFWGACRDVGDPACSAEPVPRARIAVGAGGTRVVPCGTAARWPLLPSTLPPVLSVSVQTTHLRNGLGLWDPKVPLNTSVEMAF